MSKYHNRAVTSLDKKSLIAVPLMNGVSDDMAVNGSVTPVDFTFTLPAGKFGVISRLYVYLSNGTQFGESGFAGNASPLTNGVSFLVDGEEILNAKTNIEFTTQLEHVHWGELFGKEGKSLSGSLRFVDIDRIGLFFDNTLTVKVQDDLSGLDQFKVFVLGKKFNE